jgi:hypothetical protein
MAHRNLILAYVFTWTIQIGYLIRVVLGWRRSR